MNDLLAKMDPEKRERLLNSALKEFGHNTYDKASTNVIIKEAGISKGLLYHYFDSKDKLYEYLIEYFFEEMLRLIIDQLDFDEHDILKRIQHLTHHKIAVIQKHPYIIDFAKAFYKNKNVEEAKAYIDKYVPGYYTDFYHKNVDYSLFKEGIDVQKALATVQWTLEKYSENNVDKMLQSGVDLKVMEKEVEEYITLFRQSFYK